MMKPRQPKLPQKSSFFSAPRDDTARASCEHGAKSIFYHFHLKGRFILLRALTEHGGSNFASVAEINVLGE